MVDIAVLADYAEVLGAVAIVGGFAFGLFQLRQQAARARGDAAFALMRSLQTPEMLRALVLLDGLPPGLSKKDLEQRLGDRILDVQTLLGTWESLGILVFHRGVDLGLVDDFFSGSIVHSWAKLRRYVEDLRAEVERDTRWEWFQWLAERMLERESSTPPRPAHLAHRAWRP